jgi:hypothetical protein
MSKRGKTTPPYAVPPLALEEINGGETVVPTDSVGPQEGTVGDLLAKTQQRLKEVAEQLQTEIDAHNITKAKARKWEAELKIFERADSGHEQWVQDLTARLESAIHKSETEAERWLHVRKLIVAIEDLHWERARTQNSKDDGWVTWVQRYEAAIEPLVRQTRA